MVVWATQVYSQALALIRALGKGGGHTDTSQLQLPMLCIPEISTAFIPERDKVLVFIKGLNSTVP